LKRPGFGLVFFRLSIEPPLRALDSRCTMPVPYYN